MIALEKVKILGAPVWSTGTEHGAWSTEHSKPMWSTERRTRVLVTRCCLVIGLRGQQHEVGYHVCFPFSRRGARHTAGSSRAYSPKKWIQISPGSRQPLAHEGSPLFLFFSGVRLPKTLAHGNRWLTGAAGSLSAESTFFSFSFSSFSFFWLPDV